MEVERSLRDLRYSLPARLINPSRAVNVKNQGIPHIGKIPDLSALLRHGLKDAHASGKHGPAKPSTDKPRRPERKPPPPKPTLPQYSPVLPLSQVESRISGLEKRIEQLEAIVTSMGAAERKKTGAEIKSIRSAIAHYREGLAIEKKLSGMAE